MKYRIGQPLYQCFADEDKGTVEVDEWIVRTIRKNRVTAICRCSLTWGKKSTKHGDFGWLNKIPSWLRKTFTVESGPVGLHTTKRQAYKSELDSVKRGYVTDIADMQEKLMRTLKRLINTKKKK